MTADRPPSPPKINRLEWLTLSLAMVTLQLEWAVEYAFLTPVLLRLGLSPGVASLAWLPSPLAQLVFSPWLGRLSDGWRVRADESGAVGEPKVPSGRDRQSLGCGKISRLPFWMVATRRHPFLLASAACTTAMLILIGLSGCLPDNSKDVKEEPNDDVQWIRPLLAAGAFVILDACNSINESFQRSLFTDLAVDDAVARTMGHSILSGAIGFGGTMGYLLAAVDFSAVFHSSSAMTFLFLGSAGLFALAQLLLLSKSASLTARSEALTLAQRNDNVELMSVENDDESCLMRVCDTSYGALAIEVPTSRFDSLDSNGCTTKEAVDRMVSYQSDLTSSSSWIDVLRQSSLAFRLLCIQQLFAWLGLWPVWLFATAYFGGAVYSGVPASTDGAYDAGVRAGSLACANMGLLNTIAAGLVLPTATRLYGSKATYTVLQAVGSFSVFSLYFVRERTLSTLLLAISGFSWAVNNTMSFSAVHRVCNKEDTALHTNVLYLVHTIPQLLGSLVFGPVIEFSGGNYAVAMAMSGGCGLLATIFGILWMPTSGT